mmetsp:Transcript_12439/g.34922  ORF Transcript_12439/g.34922 Transcript_12439/m.34922 type:complete len:328 (+) Transcript_12439:1292-2275(+)
MARTVCNWTGPSGCVASMCNSWLRPPCWTMVLLLYVLLKASSARAHAPTTIAFWLSGLCFRRDTTCGMAFCSRISSWLRLLSAKLAKARTTCTMTCFSILTLRREASFPMPPAAAMDAQLASLLNASSARAQAAHLEVSWWLGLNSLTRGRMPPASRMAFWLVGLSKASWLSATAATRAMSLLGGPEARSTKSGTPPASRTALLLCLLRARLLRTLAACSCTVLWCAEAFRSLKSSGMPPAFRTSSQVCEWLARLRRAPSATRVTSSCGPQRRSRMTPATPPHWRMEAQFSSLPRASCVMVRAATITISALGSRSSRRTSAGMPPAS